jgi:chromate transporter
MPEPAPATPPSNPPGRIELLVAFALISLYGFGGVLYWSRRMMVEERKWMSADAFNAAYALCNFLPGPNIVNFSVVFGREVGGTTGALVALAGLLGPPVVLVTVFGLLYATYGQAGALGRVLTGVAAAAAGLTISTGIKMAEPLLRQRSPLALCAAIAAFVTVGMLRWPIYWVLGVLVPAVIALAWWTRR